MKDFAHLVVYARQELGQGEAFARYRPLPETLARRCRDWGTAVHVAQG